VRQAIKTSKIAAVRQRHAEIAYFSIEGISEDGCVHALIISDQPEIVEVGAKE